MHLRLPLPHHPAHLQAANLNLAETTKQLQEEKVRTAGDAAGPPGHVEC